MKTIIVFLLLLSVSSTAFSQCDEIEDCSASELVLLKEFKSNKLTVEQIRKILVFCDYKQSEIKSNSYMKDCNSPFYAFDINNQANDEFLRFSTSDLKKVQGLKNDRQLKYSIISKENWSKYDFMNLTSTNSGFNVTNIGTLINNEMKVNMIVIEAKFDNTSYFFIKSY